MSSKDLIQSGILELYALGLCSKEEALRVEEALVADEQIKKEYEEICAALNYLAEERRIEPPASVKAGLMENIDALDKGVPEDAVIPETDAIEIKKARVSPTPGKTHEISPAQQATSFPPSRLVRYQWLAAASVILFFASAALNWELYKRMSSAEEEAAVLRNNNMLLSDENGILKSNYDQLDQQYAFLGNKNVEAIDLACTPEYKNSEAMVFWDKEKGDVYIIANALKPLGPDEQYQVWALDNGEPKDAGLLPTEFTEGRAYKLNNISSSQAFAITIEKKGGAGSPTLEKMVVFGKI